MNAIQISNKKFLITLSELLCNSVKKEVLPPKSGNKRPNLLKTVVVLTQNKELFCWLNIRIKMRFRDHYIKLQKNLH